MDHFYQYCLVQYGKFVQFVFGILQNFVYFHIDKICLGIIAHNFVFSFLKVMGIPNLQSDVVWWKKNLQIAGKF